MVVIIVVVFVLCWLPFFTTNIVNLVVIIPENSLTAGVYFFAVTLTYVNSCANPLLYGFLSENFKQSFQKVLCIHKVNGVGDGDPGMGQPRTQKVVTHDTLLTPRRPHFNGHMQNNQVGESAENPTGCNISLKWQGSQVDSHQKVFIGTQLLYNSEGK